jgi:hypothetical protein
MTAVRTLSTRIVAIAVLAFGLAACNPIVLSPGGGETTACPQGVWKIDSQTITDGLNLIPGLSVTGSGTGITLTLNESDWALDADQSLQASFTSPLGDANGTVHVIADAAGTYTSTASELTFTLGSLTGKADYDVTVLGHQFDGSLDLPNSALENLYGLSGTASYTCNADGLTVEFAGFQLHGHK